MPIYFAQDTHTDHIKIGVAEDIKKRISQLQTGNPNEIRVLLMIGCPNGQTGYRERDLAIERELHHRFARYRVSGEWFRPSHELLKLIHALGFGVGRQAKEQSLRGHYISVGCPCCHDGPLVVSHFHFVKESDSVHIKYRCQCCQSLHGFDIRSSERGRLDVAFPNDVEMAVIQKSEDQLVLAETPHDFGVDYLSGGFLVDYKDYDFTTKILYREAAIPIINAPPLFPHKHDKLYPAILVGIIDLGTHQGSYFYDNGATYGLHSFLYFVWEVFEAKNRDGRNNRSTCKVGKILETTLREGSSTRELFESWLGRPFVDGEEFDPITLLGKKCLVELTDQRVFSVLPPIPGIKFDISTTPLTAITIAELKAGATVPPWVPPFGKTPITRIIRDSREFMAN